jgi:hypothetical protein
LRKQRRPTGSGRRRAGQRQPDRALAGRDGKNLISRKIFADRQKYIAKSQLLRHFEVAALSAPFRFPDAETTHAAL